MRKVSLDELFREVNTPEYREEQIAETQKWFDSVSVDYMLGKYVGEYIVANHLPTLSTEYLHSNKVIQVSTEDEDANEKLHTAWTNDMENPENWKAYRQHCKELEKKYLPPVLKCRLGLTKYNDEAQFKAGLWDALWNCDMCSYDISPENVSIEHDMYIGGTIISFQYNSDVE